MKDWREEALCAQADPEAWHPAAAGISGQPAKRICAKCPSKVECLDEALSGEMVTGIWAGTSEHERRAMRRARKSAA